MLSALLLAAALAYEPTAFVRIHAKFSLGHGCVVEGNLITAEHVVGDPKRDPMVTWSDLSGREGRAIIHAWSASRDVVVLDANVGAGLKRASTPPQPGEHVSVYAYSRSGANPLRPRVIELETLGTSAGHLILKSNGEIQPGDSGGCIVNSANEVVAISVARWEYTEQRWVNIGVGLWGMWNPIPPPEPGTH